MFYNSFEQKELKIAFFYILLQLWHGSCFIYEHEYDAEGEKEMAKGNFVGAKPHVLPPSALVFRIFSDAGPRTSSRSVGGIRGSFVPVFLGPQYPQRDRRRQDRY